jgi:hypothetical protein
MGKNEDVDQITAVIAAELLRQNPGSMDLSWNEDFSDFMVFNSIDVPTLAAVLSDAFEFHPAKS